ncbi:SAM-dependent methyltransferase [Eubacterium barkeri]|uniref:Methyltransferase domain-containing protein n=1 Tax=Eubacterium barkeri TaxID=1528 RepID=A0A1H3CGV8_EUBBA|nr:class I SAM-dependent methyltransferase [Eubacterium barkeri]SDX52824.1 Methyltransferase domain-containing protein [Eubacterium barkeri]
MVELIGNVKVDYCFYSGKDDYSDGDIENEILEIVKNNTEEELEIVIAKDNRWPVLYHLSLVRQNILEWYPFEKNAEILEIGAGCGAITGVLSRKASEVTCNELSKRRSLINAYRNQDCENIKILVGNFNDVCFEKQYDYITLIGVFEYARYYTVGDSPYTDFLKRIKKLLKPQGKILMAIENKFGLKYWAGVREDHTGVFFDGIEGYHATDSKVRTFSKIELEDIIVKAGFSHCEFFYPHPDYKFPRIIFSEDCLPKEEDLTCSLDQYDNSRMYLFNETAVYKNILASKVYPFFANSFLIEIGV